MMLFSNSTTNAYFSNASNNTTTNYALRQQEILTYLNVRSGGQVNLSIGGATKAALKSDGDFISRTVSAESWSSFTYI